MIQHEHQMQKEEELEIHEFVDEIMSFIKVWRM
jgi:hypothetical protein